MNVNFAPDSQAASQLSLAGKAAIVTGGGRDIGRACAVALASKGASVGISYHTSATGAEETVAEIEGAGGKAFAYQSDLTDHAAAAALVEATAEIFDRLDILVNNSGGLVARKTIAEMEIADWHKVMDLNLTSVFP